LEDGSKEITEIQHKRKRIRKYRRAIKNMKGRIRRTYMCVVIIQESRNRENGKQAIFQEIKNEIFPQLI
jgi:hypothetical protein